MSKARTFLRLLVHLLLLRPFLRIFFGVNVQGRENVPATLPFILVANHNSHLDALLLFCLLPRTMLGLTHPVAAGDYFRRHRWLSELMEFLMDPVWVDREGEAGQALEEMSRRLREGRNLILFPEGSRGEAGEMGHFKSGIGRLLERHPEIPVVPVYILGPERSLPRKTSLPMPLWNHLIVGPPRVFQGDPHRTTGEIQSIIRNLSEIEMGRRHRRPQPRPEPASIAILGIDGSGKSTLSGNVARKLSLQGISCLISDRLQLFEQGEICSFQPLPTEKLRVWMGQRAKQASSLSGYKIPKLVEMLLRDRLLAESRRWYRPGFIVQDGCTLLNLTAWAVLYREEFAEDALVDHLLDLLTSGEAPGREDPVAHLFGEIKLLHRLNLTRLHRPQIVIFSDIPATTAMARILGRGEAMQVHENEEQLGRLRDSYRRVCEIAARKWDLPILILDGEKSPSELTAESLQFIEERAHG